MGAYCSKSDAVGAATTPPTADSAGDLHSYLSACQSDAELQHFDSALRERTERVFSTFSDRDEFRSLSLESLRAVTGCFAEVNHEVVRYVLNSQKDVWKKQELLDLVQHYFDYSEQVLAFFVTLNSCLKRAEHRKFMIELALRYFEEESKAVECGEASNSVRFSKTLQELRNFKVEGDPFNEEFFDLFRSVQDQQMLMLYKLKANHQRINQKTKSIKTYRKVSAVIFAACFVGVIVFSAVVAAIAAPHLVVALAGALSVAPIGGFGKWLSSLWKKYENELKDQAEVIKKAEMSSLLTVLELENIRFLVTKLEVEIEALMACVEFPLRDDSMVDFVIGDVKKELGGLTKAITDLEQNASMYSRDIRQARTVILQGMTRRGSNSS